MKGTRSLERLRDRVDLVVRELDRLRAENKSLRRDLERAASQQQPFDDGTSIVFAESAPELRARIESCIGAIDGYLSENGQ
jgi:regulator of replication initiation timing